MLAYMYSARLENIRIVFIATDPVGRSRLLGVIDSLTSPDERHAVEEMLPVPANQNLLYIYKLRENWSKLRKTHPKN